MRYLRNVLEQSGCVIMATMIAKIELSIPEKTNLSFYDSIDMAKDEMENKIHNAISEGELRSIISVTWEEK